MTRKEQYCALLSKAVRDERQAIMMYRKLARLAPTDLARSAHIRMGADETLHLKMDRLLCRRYCR